MHVHSCAHASASMHVPLMLTNTSDTDFCCEVESPDLLCCTVQKVTGQVTSLKASRDKLLAEVDRQSTETDRLLTHNATLEQVSFSPPACLLLLQ